MSAVSVLLRNGSHEPHRPEFPNRATFGKRRVLSGVHSGPQILISNEDEPSCLSSARNPHSAETAHDSFRRTPSAQTRPHSGRKLPNYSPHATKLYPLVPVLHIPSFQSVNNTFRDRFIGSRFRTPVAECGGFLGCGVCFWWPSHVPTTDVARCSFAFSPAGLVSREREIDGSRCV